jgi:hypothetical protein
MLAGQLAGAGLKRAATGHLNPELPPRGEGWIGLKTLVHLP